MSDFLLLSLDRATPAACARVAPSRRRSLLTACATLLALATGAGWIAWRTWPRSLEARISSPLPRVVIERGRLQLVSPSGILLARVASFSDELTAYLEFEYLKTLPRIDPARVLFVCSDTDQALPYKLFLHLEPDLLTALPALAEFESERYIAGSTWEFPDRRVLADFADQTQMFVTAYNLPVKQRLAELAPKQLLPAVTRFMLFKSRTDRRLRKRIEPVPVALSQEQAQSLAGDVTSVARFYSLPLDFFLGIGAMENNYMVALGDLDHKVWKRRAQPGDIVVARKRRRVLVLNYSVGVWQITREALRRAHSLYLKGRATAPASYPRSRRSARLRTDDLRRSPVPITVGPLSGPRPDGSRSLQRRRRASQRTLCGGCDQGRRLCPAHP